MVIIGVPSKEFYSNLIQYSSNSSTEKHCFVVLEYQTIDLKHLSFFDKIKNSGMKKLIG